MIPMLFRNFIVKNRWSVATHFEKKIQSALNLGPNQRTLKKFSKCVKFGTNLTHFEKEFQSALRVYINITFDINF